MPPSSKSQAPNPKRVSTPNIQTAPIQYFNGLSPPAAGLGTSAGLPALGASKGLGAGGLAAVAPAPPPLTSSFKFATGPAPPPVPATGVTAGVPSTPIIICTPLYFGTGNNCFTACAL